MVKVYNTQSRFAYRHINAKNVPSKNLPYATKMSICTIILNYNKKCEISYSTITEMIDIIRKSLKTVCKTPNNF